MTPQKIISGWLPHLILLIILCVSFVFLYIVFESLLSPIFVSASIFVLTYPIIYSPLKKLLHPYLGHYSETFYLNVIAILSIMTLGSIIFLPIFFTLILSSGSIEVFLNHIYGIITQDQVLINQLVQSLITELRGFQTMYPDLPISLLSIEQALINFFNECSNISPRLLTHFFKGTSSALAHLIITIISLIFFYSYGPSFIRATFSISAFPQKDIDALFRLYRSTIIRLLNDSIFRAIIKGLSMAILIHIFTGFNFTLIFYFASFVSLLPLIGGSMIWIPMSSILWSQSLHFLAFSLAILCVSSNFCIDWFIKRNGKKIQTQSQWMSFLLFIGIISGILSLGIKGIVFGPVAIISAIVLTKFWFQLYKQPIT